MEPSPRIFYRILRLKQIVAVSMEEALKPAGLTANQYTVLTLVRRFAPVTSAELARKLQISAQSMGESLKSLESRGLVSRSVSPANRRQVLFVLTAEGKKLTLKADKLVAREEERFMSSLTPGAAAALEQALATLRSQQALPAESQAEKHAETAA
jgi:DNA-binding MarR family transcriptional regulator